MALNQKFSNLDLTTHESYSSHLFAKVDQRMDGNTDPKLRQAHLFKALKLNSFYLRMYRRINLLDVPQATATFLQHLLHQQ